MVLLIIIIVSACFTWKHCRSKRGYKGKISEDFTTPTSVKLAEMSLLDWDAIAVGKTVD
jgi:hypothetical protein